MKVIPSVRYIAAVLLLLSAVYTEAGVLTNRLRQKREVLSLNGGLDNGGWNAGLNYGDTFDNGNGKWGINAGYNSGSDTWNYGANYDREFDKGNGKWGLNADYNSRSNTWNYGANYGRKFDHGNGEWNIGSTYNDKGGLKVNGGLNWKF